MIKRAQSSSETYISKEIKDFNIFKKLYLKFNDQQKKSNFFVIFEKLFKIIAENDFIVRCKK